MNQREGDPEGSDFSRHRARKDGASWSTSILVTVLGSLLVFLVLYFFNDTLARSRDMSSQLSIVTTKITDMDIKLVHMQDALDLARDDRTETRLELDDLRKQVAILRGMK